MSELTEDTNDRLEGGTYEILQKRLQDQGKELQERLKKLNIDRKEAFGAVETKLLATERITTENNCVPWDMVAIGDILLFGYNVQFGLKNETKVDDVLAAFTIKGRQYEKVDYEVLYDKAFIDDFRNLYKYYKNTHFLKFSVLGSFLFMVFRTGKKVDDIKAFKWLIKEDELVYQDARSDHEFKFPTQQEFEWVKTTREMHRDGQFPHISIEDKVFVEAIDGDITIKVEDNTDSGKGIFMEPVENRDQSLDDADIFYAIVGNLILFKIKPFQERVYRYIIFNQKLQQARRIDAVGNACIMLPDDQGVIFHNGFYLQSGEYKLFDIQLDDMMFERRVFSPNGEDILFVFYNRFDGTYLLLSYNIIEQGVATPIVCHGFCIFENGELHFFKGDSEPKKHHAIQIWQTPFIGADFEIPNQGENYLSKIGNKELVRMMADCNDVIKLIYKDDSYNDLYVDILKTATSTMDAYFWLGDQEVGNLKEPLEEIKGVASTALNEYEKVVKIKKATKDEFERVTKELEHILATIKRNRPENVNDFVGYLSDLRSMRGELIALRELRYINLDQVQAFEEEVINESDDLSQRCVAFLVRKESLDPYKAKVIEIEGGISKVTKVVEADEVEEQIDASAGELELLIDVVSNLKIKDKTQTTAIIDQITGIYSGYNKLRAGLKKKRIELLSVEGEAEFVAQMRLLDQGTISFLDLCDTPESCEEYLTKLMIQLEELEGRFSEFSEFIEKITTKREEIYNAFESKKIELQESRNRKVSALSQSGERIIKSVEHRLAQFEDEQEINAYFASDLMIEKVRDIIENLIEIGDTVKSDDIQSKLKSTRENAIKQLKDKKELFLDGDNIISFGNHKFLVNTQELGLTVVERKGYLNYHLAGTNFFEPMQKEQIDPYRTVWSQGLVSENREVYRSEYLAYSIFEESKEVAPKNENGILTEDELHTLAFEDLVKYVQKIMSLRFNEGYVKGIHDHDAAKILSELVFLHFEADRLRFQASARACANVYWDFYVTEEEKAVLLKQLKGAGLILSVFKESNEFDHLKANLNQKITSFVQETNLFDSHDITAAAEYLFQELACHDRFVVDGTAADLLKQFEKTLSVKKAKTAFRNSLITLEGHPLKQFRLAKSWVNSWLQDSEHKSQTQYADELTYLVLIEKVHPNHVVNVSIEKDLEGMLGTHQLIKDEKYHLHYHTFMKKLGDYTKVNAELFNQFRELKKNLARSFEKELRLSEFKPRVMSSFVRNKLINSVYLPLIGANLSKQIGEAGTDKRTDLMGMLLLISPPGYGKTTLMEYIASRLGVVFMKINGPAIGHEVTSVDPDRAPNAGAKEELKKLNLAFEMGDNVMIYLDDIQHCNPEFLQKFISLCDGQRKIEGVYKGQPKTYDFRGKKVCVVMAGNPYTESGDKFQIPDMLANRADIYNLGDIIGDSANAFELSYIENSASSNAYLSRIASKSHSDFLKVIQAAERDDITEMQLEGNHGQGDVADCYEVVKKLLVIKDVILKVNMAYIDSAAQADAYRAEPPFKLQGSYRNMNKIVEKIVPIMNYDELDTLILSHYENESQTLTSGAEANFLKFKELIADITEEEKERWEDIKKQFVVNNRAKHSKGVDISPIENKLSELTESLHGIRGSLAQNAQGTTNALLLEVLDKLSDAVRKK